MKLKKVGFVALSILLTTLTTACNPFIFTQPGAVPFKGCENSIFFALYNYYGIPDQHFTNKWMGMNDALLEHGVKVTGWEAEKDAKKFQIEYLPNCDLPKDRQIYMVNNQTWDVGLQFNKPLNKYKPIAVISTCNGVEFASTPIKASGLGTQNATMGNFCENYRNAFVDGSLSYLVTKYTAHIAPIFAACVDAVDNGVAMKDAEGNALQLSVVNWAVDSLEEYDELSKYDQYIVDKEKGIHPTIVKANLDPFFEKGNPLNNAEALSEWISKSDEESIKALYEGNATITDTKREGRQLKCGLLVPGSVNDTVQSYIDYMKGYLGSAYNVTFAQEAISTTNTQSIATKTLINQKCDFIISLQDDTDRNAAIKVADSFNTYFGIVGTCQNPTDFNITKKIKHFVGSVGTSIEEERRAAKEMTEYYLDKMIELNK